MYQKVFLNSNEWKYTYNIQTDAKVNEKIEDNYTWELMPQHYHPNICVYTNPSRITSKREKYDSINWIGIMNKAHSWVTSSTQHQNRENPKKPN